MKTITIKLPEKEAKELDLFVKKSSYPSKSEFIRNLIMKKMEEQEKMGWLAIAERSLAKDWLSKEDEEAWKDL